jgi:hypothetical protein
MPNHATGLGSGMRLDRAVLATVAACLSSTVSRPYIPRVSLLDRASGALANVRAAVGEGR